MFCSNCGKEILDNQNFCNYCGTKVIKNNNSVDNNTNLSDSELANKIIENKDNISNAVNYVMQSKKLDQPSARKYVDKVFKDNGIATTPNNTSSKTIQKNVIKISFSKCVILIVLIALFFVIPIIISSINRNNAPLSKETPNNTEFHDTDIDIAGITQEEREELTSILKNFNPSERICESVATIGNYYLKLDNDYYNNASFHGHINDKGYIDELFVEKIDKYTNESKCIETYVKYVYDDKGRPTDIRLNNNNSTYRFNIKDFEEYNITYFDNDKIKTIACISYDKQKELDEYFYTFHYKDNGDYDYISLKFIGKAYKSSRL